MLENQKFLESKDIILPIFEELLNEEDGIVYENNEPFKTTRSSRKPSRSSKRLSKEVEEEEDPNEYHSNELFKVTKVETENHNEITTIDDALPLHLKTRIPSSKSDTEIREFVELKCNICDVDKFETFKQVQEHYATIHNCKGYVICCEKRIYRKDRLRNHIINHINPDAFKCPYCDQKSKSKILLKIHLKQHLPVNERPHQCYTCGQKFVLKSQLTNHEATHFTEEQKKFVCDECGKAFALKFVMIKHKQTHTKVRNFVCEICAKTFVTISNLQAHMLNHTDGPTPRVQCKICGSYYKNVDTLRTHMRRHRDTREHICDTCGKKCTTKSSLAAHIRYVHLKVREFVCNVCKREFRRKLELTEHMARHTGKALYKCPFCPKTFTSSSNYFSHRKNRHPSEFAGISKTNENDYDEEAE